MNKIGRLVHTAQSFVYNQASKISVATTAIGFVTASVGFVVADSPHGFSTKLLPQASKPKWNATARTYIAKKVYGDSHQEGGGYWEIQSLSQWTHHLHNVTAGKEDSDEVNLAMVGDYTIIFYDLKGEIRVKVGDLKELMEILEPVPTEAAFRIRVMNIACVGLGSCCLGLTGCIFLWWK